MGDVIDLAQRRDLKRRIIKAYNDARTDWCHHELAVDIAATATGQRIATVRRHVENPK